MSTSNRSNRSNLARIHSIPAQQASRVVDEDVRLACRGDRPAAGRVFQALQGLLVIAAREHLGPFEQDAEDVVQDLMVEMLEGHLRPTAREDAATMLLRVAGEMARRHRTRTARRWLHEHAGGWNE